MSTDNDPLSALALPDQSRVNAICDQFEEALQQGLEQCIEGLLADTSGRVRDVLFRELLLLECEHALRQGGDLHELRLAERFPDQSKSIREAMDLARSNLLIEAEVAGRSPGPAVWPSGLPQTFGRFRVLSVLGQGAFGTVFRAVDTDNGNEVALKVPHLVTLVSPDLRERFFREARAAAALEHRGIVRLLEVGEEGLVCYIVSEYVSGTTLAAWLSRCYEKQERIPCETAAQLVVSLAAAMQYAHDEGVFHYDLKPANVLLRDGRTTDPVVTDFSLARLVGEGTKLTLTGQVLGTPAYMAPEQAFGPRRQLGPGPDVYGLGAILYEMLTGRPPFQAGTPLEIMLQKRNAEPISPRALVPQVPRALETVCIKCLEVQPEKRYASAGALAADLERWLRGEPVQARPVGLLRRGRRWCRRRPLIAGLVAALALALLGVFTGILFQWRRTETARRDAEAAHRAAETSARESQEALNELTKVTRATPFFLDFSQGISRIEPLQKAENHLRHELEQNPQRQELWADWIGIQGKLADAYGWNGQLREAERCLLDATKLCEPLALRDPHNRLYRKWLAILKQKYAGVLVSAKVEQYQEHLEAFWEACGLWQELLREDPGNIEFLDLFEHCQVNEMQLPDDLTFRIAAKPILQRDLPVLAFKVSRDAGNEAARWRLALTCFLLGEIEHANHREKEATDHWLQAHELYGRMAPSPTPDCMTELFFGLCCYRLMPAASNERYYRDAIRLFERVDKQLADILAKSPFMPGLWNAFLKSQRSLVLCHWKAGNAIEGDKAYRSMLKALIVQVEKYPANIDAFFRMICAPIETGHALRDAQNPAAALALAREAAAEMSGRAKMQSMPTYELNSKERLADAYLSLAALLCQLDDASLSLRFAEEARRMCESLCQQIPNLPRYCVGLGSAWERIGKAHSKLKEWDKAEAAFRESAATGRRRLELAPSYANRVSLSRCFDRLAGACNERNDWSEVAKTLLEKEQLWSEYPKELRNVSRSFQDLADRVGKRMKQLLPSVLAERNRYLAESERIARRADAIPQASH